MLLRKVRILSEAMMGSFWKSFRCGEVYRLSYGASRDHLNGVVTEKQDAKGIAKRFIENREADKVIIQ